MRIAIHTLGTRGDVQPYLALALGLTAAGHEVSLAAPAQFEDFVRSRGIGFASLPREFLDLMEDPEAKAAMAGSKGGFAVGLKLLKKVGPVMQRLFDQLWEAARGFEPDLIVFHPKALASPHIGEKLGVPVILASPLPGYTPTSAFPSPILSKPVPRFMNRISHDFLAGAGTALFNGALRRWRATALGLPRRSRLPRWRDLPTLYAYSPAVLPSPSDWGPQVLVSGYWFLDEPGEWSPPPDLAAFLAGGPPPVYVGFGSMPTADPVAMTAELVEAVTLSGQRAVLASGWAKLTATGLPDTVHLIESAPHDRLFPLMSAVVHHGGAGSTGAGLRAGRPSVICPFFGDQPFWGRRVAELGAGPPPLIASAMTVPALADAIRTAATDPRMRARATLLGEAIRAERGIEAAIAFIERTVPARAAA